MIDTTALVALACLIANNQGKVLDTSPLEAQLSSWEVKRVQDIIHQGACLPESVEKLITRTQEKVKKGEIIQTASAGDPTRDTL